ncbi:hypothetical protein M501DRAFT_1019959 [Patellaria atrata CBS 101060]|uniref:Uncharacterized protein n=1 Tax=Patellaria atrata CBS 101060 TaxID=1346257 RepID=A0A9P4S351_9PEZI|nr:hypothetical protein M501DRAFT_1019959 [Patellaria atrata CBS 101060]
MAQVTEGGPPGNLSSSSQKSLDEVLNSVLGNYDPTESRVRVQAVPPIKPTAQKNVYPAGCDKMSDEEKAALGELALENCCLKWYDQKSGTEEPGLYLRTDLRLGGLLDNALSIFEPFISESDIVIRLSAHLGLTLDSTECLRFKNLTLAGCMTGVRIVFDDLKKEAARKLDPKGESSRQPTAPPPSSSEVPGSLPPGLGPSSSLVNKGKVHLIIQRVLSLRKFPQKLLTKGTQPKFFQS